MIVPSQIIGISGVKESGKSTFAKMIHGHNPEWVIVETSDEMKTMLSEIFGIHLESFNDRSLKEQPFKEEIYIDQYLPELCKYTGLQLPLTGLCATTPRELMQRVATDVVQQIDKTYWIRQTIKNARRHPKCIVSGIRFPHDASAIHVAGGKVIKIKRLGQLLGDTHLSETSIDQIVPDLLLATVESNLSLPDWIADQLSYHGVHEWDSQIKYFDWRRVLAATISFQCDQNWDDAQRLLNCSLVQTEYILNYYLGKIK